MTIEELPNEYSGTTVMMPGSYDPITLGHLTQIERAARIFDRVHVVVCINPEKTYMFSVDQRVALIRAAVKDIRNGTVSSWDGLVVDFAKNFKVDFILKGIRNDEDLAYERAQADWNEAHGFTTLFAYATKGTSHISSTLLRDKLKEGRSIHHLCAPNTEWLIKEYMKDRQYAPFF